MHFKCDENLPVEVAEIFRQHGHGALTALEQQLGGMPDDHLVAVCHREGRCLVTLDLDFSDIRAYPPEKHAGIIVLRPAVQTTASLAHMASRVVALLDIEVVAGRLWVVDESRVRIRGDNPTCLP